MKRTRRLDQTGPLYKLEWYDQDFHVWRITRHLYDTSEAAARAARTAPEKTWRLMEVSQHGYRPVCLPQ